MALPAPGRYPSPPMAPSAFLRGLRWVLVAKAGGWNSLESLKTAYQQEDEATMLQVVLEAGELREVR